MKIIISEKQLDKILGDPDILNEQNQSTDEGQVIVLRNVINKLLDDKQKEILDRTGIQILPGSQDLTLLIGKQQYPLTLRTQGVYGYVIPPNTRLPFRGVSMTELLPQIEKDKTYQYLVEKYPEVKEQISKGVANGMIYTENEQGSFVFRVTKRALDISDEKTAISIKKSYPLGEFFENNKAIFRFKSGAYGTLESGSILMTLIAPEIKIKPGPTQLAPQTIAITTLSLQDSFNFDDINFKDETQTNQQLEAFIQDTKAKVTKYGEPLIKHIQSQNPTIIGYSSIDGDPNQAITGKYQPCSGNKTRKDYDLCLSQERSKIIADRLNKALPELGNAFKFKGMGETNHFNGVGWTKENPTIPDETAPNRAYTLSPIKPFMATQ
jgi:hypothetical protein